MPITALPAVSTHLVAGIAAIQAVVAVFLANTTIYALAGATLAVVLGLLVVSPWMVWRLLGRHQRPDAGVPQSDINQMRLSAIVESSEDAIIGKDERGIVTSWNRSAEKIFGYSAEEMVGKSIRCLLPADRDQEEDGFLNRIKAGERVDHLETVRQRKDGQLISVEITISPIRDAIGRIVGASKIARDITEKKQLQRRLQQSQKMEAVGQLTGGIAHDFNNLLAVIIGNLDLLEPLVEGREAALRRVQIAQRAAVRGTDLTRRLLAFSRQDELRPSTTSLEASVQNMIELASHGLGPEISMTTHFNGEVPPIYVDAAGLENALLNLAVNARDAMPHGGSIVVSTYLREVDERNRRVLTEGLKAGMYACVSVSDTGEGMSAETMERVFEPFFTTKGPGRGTGLGLAMVYGFVKQSGGAIRINSEPGYGTTVLMYLPLAERSSALLRGMNQPAPPAKVGKVLVVDDEPDLLEISLAYLAELGYTGATAKNGADALEVLAKHGPFDLLVTDIVMPGGLNGVDLAQMVRELSPQTRVIYSSGFTADALAAKSLALKEGPLLRKPFRRAEFSTVIHQVMEEVAGVPVHMSLQHAEKVWGAANG